MPTEINFTIKKDGTGNYTTIKSFVAGEAGNLVAADENHVVTINCYERSRKMNAGKLNKPFVTASIFVLACSPVAFGQYAIDWSTVDGGGGTSSGGGYELRGTIGQPDASLVPHTADLNRHRNRSRIPCASLDTDTDTDSKNLAQS